MTQTHILCGGMRIFANGTKQHYATFMVTGVLSWGCPMPPPTVIMSLWSFNSPHSTAPAGSNKQTNTLTAHIRPTEPPQQPCR